MLPLMVFNQSSAGPSLYSKQLLMSDNVNGATAQHRLSFTLPSSSTYGSVEIQYCANSPLPELPCTVPGGFDISNAALTTQTGQTGFVIAPGATSNRLVLSRTPAIAPAGSNASYTFSPVTNPSSPGSYYLRLRTFASADASGPEVFGGGIGISINNAISIRATVPPYLTFCTGITISGLNCATVNGDYLDFGELSSTATRSGTSQMLVSSNAQSGYNISVQGTTMTSGNNIIDALFTSDVSRPGTAQFGLNLAVNSTPSGGASPHGPGLAMPMPNYSVPNMYRFVSGETLVSTSGPDDVRVFTTAYVVNVPKTQAPGIYVTTITYICLGTFQVACARYTLLLILSLKKGNNRDV